MTVTDRNAEGRNAGRAPRSQVFHAALRQSHLLFAWEEVKGLLTGLRKGLIVAARLIK
jgi:hypothetical protein